MTEIYNDASYFSTIRDEGKAEIAFFDKPSKSLMNISADMTRYGVTSSAPYAVIRGGDYSRLKEIEYDYNGNGKTEASGLMPLNSLGFSVEFLSDLSIILEPTADGFDRDNGCNIVVILDHKETEIPDMIEEIYALYYHGGLWDGKPCAVDYYSRCGLCFCTVHIMDGFNAISEKIERIDISAHDPYMLGWKLRGVLVIPEDKTAEDIIQPVDNGDIENLTITSKYDITRYALPSVEAEIKLFNFGKKYTDIQPDMVLVMNKYTDTDSDVTYYSDTRAYFIDGVGNPDNSTDTPRVTFKAVDLLTKLNMNYSCDISADELNYARKAETSVGGKITKVLQSAQSDFPLCNSGVYSEFNTGKTANSALDYTWRYNAVTNVPYNTVLQKLISVTWAYPVAVDDVITFEGAATGSYDSMAKVGNPKGSGAAIKLREQMAKPKITVNPCTQLVTQSLNMCKYKDGVKGDSRETDWLEQICSVTVRFEGADIPQKIKYEGTWVILPSYIYDDGYTDYGVYISDDVNFRAWYSNNEVPGFTFKNNTAESYVEITPYDSKIKGNTTSLDSIGCNVCTTARTSGRSESYPARSQNVYFAPVCIIA